jgi:hypothetical protein
MPNDEFDQYMSGKVVPVSTWDSALLMCEVKICLEVSLNYFQLILYVQGMHVINEQLATLSDLDSRNKNTMASAKALHEEIIAFQVTTLKLFKKTCL